MTLFSRFRREVVIAAGTADSPGIAPDDSLASSFRMNKKGSSPACSLYSSSSGSSVTVQSLLFCLVDNGDDRITQRICSAILSSVDRILPCRNGVSYFLFPLFTLNIRIRFNFDAISCSGGPGRDLVSSSSGCCLS